ncbi:hypothetical protein [Halobaculum sp. D14]|uniref:hypothetical protein n=1 Tax=Halobaculum sp. D14 TaxID=3421642 RepID=UPI003EB94FC2
MNTENLAQEVGWHFYDGGQSAPRFGGDPTKHAVDHNTESFVREVLQNANDQALPNDMPVEVTFRLVELSGGELREFLEAIGWESELRERIGAVAESDRGRGFKQFQETLEDEEPSLRVLVVEDKNTTGLTGSWSEDSNYAALVRDELYSQKQDETAGGSYGLGKSVLWTFSGASTVVFNSYLSEPSDRGDRRRLIARTKLPTHSLSGDDTEYQGAGWLCTIDDTEEDPKPRSLWGATAESLAERLGVDRPSTPGTSAMVVGFRDPARDHTPSLESLGRELVDAAAKYFWPAMYRDDLEVNVQVGSETTEVDVDDHSAVQPFVDAYANRYNGETRLETPGDVAGRDIEVDLPKKDDGTESESGPVRLAARLASPIDDPTLRNHVAMFRGAGMVVKYYDQSRVSFGDRNFFGVLAAGTARSTGAPRKSDDEIDRFLRFAEPPEHDEWRSTENLKQQYMQGYRKAIVNLEADIREELRNLVSRSGRGERDLPENVLKKFPIHGQGRRSSSPANSQSFELDGTAFFERNRWRFSGSVEPEADDHSGWTAEVSLTGVGEDGTKYRQVPIDSVNVDVEGVDVVEEDGAMVLRASPSVGRVEFQGESRLIGHVDFFDGSVGETRLEVDAEVRLGGGD